MKLKHLVETVKGSWTVHNMVGTPKVFKDVTSPGALAWMKSHDRPASKPDKQFDDMFKQAPEPTVKKPTLDEIYNHGVYAVGDSMPDGDPGDKLWQWLNRYGLTMDDADRAFKKKEKTTFYGYVAQVWDSLAGDALHDAKNGHIDDNSPFYVPVTPADVELRKNPWK